MTERTFQEPGALGIYVHIPFCEKHCAYCDFNTYVEEARAAVVGQTVDAICFDIERTGREVAKETAPGSRRAATVFFGGGTPTFLAGAQLGRILEAVRSSFDVASDAEISSEANPGSSDAEKFAAMREAGFNRLSVGVQSFNDRLLVALDRFHTAGEADKTLSLARDAGFTNLSLDLMFGLPGQSLALWQATLDHALILDTEHLSLYSLTLEPGTRFERLNAGGKLHLPDEDAEAAMYERSIDYLTATGYEHYEVSNFARPGFRARHNCIYWRNEEYLGFGPGAVSYLDGRRWTRERLPDRYAAKVRDGADLAIESERLDVDGALGETIMLGLRLSDGLPLQRIRDRFGVEPQARFAEQIARLSARGLLTMEDDSLRLTRRGLFLANDVLSEFIA